MLYIMEETAAFREEMLLFEKLPKEEQEYLRKRKRERAFAEGLLARGLLFYGLKKEFGLQKYPRIARTEKGKPYFPDYPDICFNVSHTKDRVMVLLDEGPVGADIQNTISFRENLMRKIAHEKEILLLMSKGALFEGDSLAGPKKPENSFEIRPNLTPLWCLKEAYLKFTGEGIRRPLKELDFSQILMGETLRYEGAFCRFFEGTDYSYAVFQETPPPETAVYVEEQELAKTLF